jgi:mannose/fructose/N-acetylgalactosamine-specific phosphotransferase system component IID
LAVVTFKIQHMIDKKLLWPKTGKLKKAAIILLVVIVTAVAATWVEEKTKIKLSERAIFPIALACVAVWFYQPLKKIPDNTSNE